MPSTHDQVFNLDDELDALSTPTTLEVLAHSQDYDADIVAAAAARRAINAGTGGPGASAAEDVSFDPAGNISSTDVQAAIEELDAQIVSAVSDLVASAPGALDTLDELAAALGDDANFATTVTNALAAKQPLDSDLTAIAALSTTAFGRGLLELANQAALLAAAGAADAARTITAGSGLTGGGDLSADRTLDVNVDGSTLEISSDALRVKAAGILASHIGDAELAALAGLTSAADKGIQFTGSGTAGTFDLTTAGKALLDDADAAAQRSTLGLGSLATLSAISSSEITDGSIVNADVSGSAAIAYSKLNLAASIVAGDFSDAEIAALAGLVSAADRLPYFTGSGTASLATFTSAGRALVDDADAAAQRTTLGLGSLATLSAVSSSEITDGTIVNGDVSASAAIADTKLAYLLASRQAGTATGSGEQTLFTYTLPANTLATNKGIRITFIARRSTGSGNVTWTPKFGSVGLAPLGATSGAGTKFEIYIWNDNSSSAQRYDVFQWSATTNGHTWGNTSLDTTSNQTIGLYITLATSSDVVTMDWASVEYLG